MDVGYDDFFGTDLEGMLDAVEANQNDECIYALGLGLFGYNAAEVSYVSSLGVIGSESGMVDDETYEGYMATVVNKADELGFKVYDGIVQKALNYTVRLHGTVFSDPNVTVEDYFEKMSDDGFSGGTVHYVKEHTGGFGDILVGGFITRNQLYTFNGLIDSESTLFEDTAEKYGFKVKQGLTKEMNDILDAFDDERQED